MAPILSACLVMNRCGDEIDVALRCIQNADLEVSVFLSDNSPEELAFLGRGTEMKLCIIPLARVPAYQSFEIDGCQKIVLTAPLVRHFLPLLLKKENIQCSTPINDP